MREAHKEVEGIFSDFDLLAGFEVEGAKTRFDRCFFEELWVEIGYGSAGEMFDSEIRIA